MKICIIGNSHVAALKSAWENHFDESNKRQINITFFAARGNALKFLKPDSNRLIPTTRQLEKSLTFTSAGETFIDLNAYNAFLLYGLYTDPYHVNDLFYSKALIEDFIKEYSSDSLMLSILEMIPQDLGKKIYIGHNPMYCEKPEVNRQLAESPYDYYYRGISFINDRIFSLYGAELLPQPNHTIAANGRNTLSKYCKGSKRLAVGKNDDNCLHSGSHNERSHMNDSYGKAWLDQFLLHVANDQ